jgi:hypothetical protein
MATLSVFPSQKKTLRQKTDSWAKDCVEAGVELVNYSSDSGIRASFYEKQTNYDLANNILDPKDIERTVNPWNMRGADFPVEMRNYALTKPKIDLLVGEEMKRRFDYRVVVKNDDAISDKERLIKDKYLKFLSDKITAENFDEQKVQEELKKLDQWRLYEAQDLRERMSTQILSVLWTTERLQYKFNRGFEDALISGEEIYSVQIINGEPTVTKENPLNIVTLRSGDSIYVEDSDIIIKDGFHGIGQVIDDYFEYLTPKDIDEIESGNKLNKAISMLNYPTNSDIPIPQNYMMEAFGDTIVVPDNKMLNAFSGTFDTKGNIRVTQVVWRSRRKIGKLSYYDEFGDQQFEWVDEAHTPNEALGEEVEWKWVNEWWEGTRIGQDIFVKMQPLPRIGNSMTNPSTSLCPFVGTLYNINNSKAMSLMSYMKPYQYLYNAIMYNTELAMTKNKGKIGFLPMHLIPDGWDVDTWMYYFNTMGVAVIDGFKESSKGTMAGTVNQTPTSMDLEMGNYIQSNIGMLQMIKQHVDEISGVSPQRQGQVEQRELVGNVERAVTQSSHITEKWFFIHDWTKIRVLEALLETAKYAWRHHKEKRQYAMDDMTMAILDLDGEAFATAEYGVVVSNSSRDAELMAALKSLAQAGLQNDKLSFADIMTIYMSDSISTTRRKIQGAEEQRGQQAQQAQQQEQEAMAAQLQQKADSEQADRDLKWDIAVLQAGTDSERSESEEPKDTALEERKLSLSERKATDDTTLKRESLAETIRSNRVNEDIKRKAANKPASTKK